MMRCISTPSGPLASPTPTTAGDFCRRFDPADVERLMDTLNQTRLRVWKQQPDAFFDEAIIDADGTLTPHRRLVQAGRRHLLQRPVVLSSPGRLAGPTPPSRCFWPTAPATAPSHEGAHGYLDRAITLCRQGGFRRVTLRGDTDFQPNQVSRRLGCGAVSAFCLRHRRPEEPEGSGRGPAPPGSFSVLKRPARYEIKTTPSEHSARPQDADRRGPRVRGRSA